MLCGNQFGSLDQAIRRFICRIVDAFTHRKPSHSSRVVGRSMSANRPDAEVGALSHIE